MGIIILAKRLHGSDTERQLVQLVEDMGIRVKPMRDVSQLFISVSEEVVEE